MWGARMWGLCFVMGRFAVFGLGVWHADPSLGVQGLLQNRNVRASQHRRHIDSKEAPELFAFPQNPWTRRSSPS